MLRLKHTPSLAWRRVERALIGLSWAGAAYLAVRIAQGLLGE